MRSEQPLRRRGVVVIEHDGIRRNRARDARRAGLSQGERAGSRLDEQGIGVPVVTAFELDDLRPARVPAREPDRSHGGLRPGVDQAHALEGRHELREQFRQLDLGFGRGTEREAFFSGLLHGLHDVGMRVTGDERAPRADVVDVGVAVGVPYGRPFAPLYERRRAPDRLKRAHRGIDAARNAQECALEERSAALHGGVTRDP
jgi:hypothetical protein